MTIRTHYNISQLISLALKSCRHASMARYNTLKYLFLVLGHLGKSCNRQL